MSAFLQNFGDDFDYHLCQDYPEPEICQKEIWRQALQWTLKRLEINYPDDFDAMDITKDIKKELQEIEDE